jgi:hypothetical protein
MPVNSKVISVATAIVTMLVMAAPASADLCSLIGIGCPPTGGGGTTPELDPNLIGGTVTVLVGGLLMLVERRRRS